MKIQIDAQTVNKVMEMTDEQYQHYTSYLADIRADLKAAVHYGEMTPEAALAKYETEAAQAADKVFELFPAQEPDPVITLRQTSPSRHRLFKRA